MSSVVFWNLLYFVHTNSSWQGLNWWYFASVSISISNVTGMYKNLPENCKLFRSSVVFLSSLF